jgi:hypothetical protein
MNIVGVAIIPLKPPSLAPKFYRGTSNALGSRLSDLGGRIKVGFSDLT